MSIASAVAQRTITLSIHRNDIDARVRYSFWSPMTGETVYQAPQCKLQCDRPTNYLFVLDYESTLHGWTIINSKPTKGSPALETVIGANGQSISNFNPHSNDSESYHFGFTYKNTKTGAEIFVDPQEDNVRI